jgi:hypothetical protein
VVNTTGIRVVLTAILVIGALGATGAGPTRSEFTDERAGTSNVTAADDFKQSFPSDAVAYDDANANGQYDGGESTYTTSDLSDLDDSTVSLRFHSSVNKVSMGGSSISVANIGTDTDVKLRIGTLNWSVSGELEVDNADIRADSVTFTSDDGNISASNTVTKKTGSVRMTAHRGNVDLSYGDLRADNSIQVYAQTGRIDVTGTNCRASIEDLQDSNGTVNC